MYDDANKTSPLLKHGEELNKIRNYIDTCEPSLSKLNEKKQKLEEQNELEPHSVTEDNFVTIDKRIRTEKKN